MYLDVEIEALTVAIERLTAVLSNANNTANFYQPAAQVALSECTSKSAADQTRAAQDAPAASDTIPYDDVKKAVLALALAKGREAAVAVLQPFGVLKATELRPEQYIAARDAALAATETVDEAAA